MGVPSFYKWLLDSFPRSVVDAVVDSSPAADLTGPNPNGVEFDNLYVDMNGIIHPCFHPEGLPAPKTYDEVFQNVFKYINRVFSIVRPRKLLYLAIDGVAPRAKMNQQRSRRFRAAKDAADEAAQKEEIGGNVSESLKKSTCLEQCSKLDSNVITPGTEFMVLLSSALHYYIHLRMNEEPGWQGVKVMLSDASVPGEGEHKIMSYIRSQRNLPGFDPNTRHCLYGLDADLIMLALATHEIHFSILREDVRKPSLFPKSGRDSSRMNQQEVGNAQVQTEVVSESMEDYISKLKFQFLHVWILREYLAYAMNVPDPMVKLERLIDDFVLMCLFVGNDFLPHVPSLEISEGAIDLLMTVYKKEFATMGYLTKSFKVNLRKMEHFLKAVGSHEGAILRKRMQKKRERDVLDRYFSKQASVRATPVGGDSTNSRMLGVRAPKGSALLGTNTGVDKIKYGEVGWKERYYAEKFEAETEDDRERIRRDVVLKYAEGILWVMHYYYVGVCSWQWFYPYHYAPFASDFHNIENLEIQFTLGQPFKPFDQLMAVLPSASAHALPLFYRKLMTETSSPLVAFYPTDFELDTNGKRFAWQGICKLPFIEESLLLSEIARVEHTLTDEERQRNRLGLNVLFIHISQPLAMEIVSFYKRNMGNPELVMDEVKEKIDPNLSGGMNGFIFISDKPVQPERIDSPIDGMEMIANNQVLSVFYGSPPFRVRFPKPPENVAWPSKCIRKKDIKPKPFLWHEQTAVVERLHSQMPIRKAIYGPRLAKSARQLVLTWSLEMQQKSAQSAERGEGASAYRGDAGANGPTPVRCAVETASVGNTAGDAGANGPTPILCTVETASTVDTAADAGANGLAPVPCTVETASIGDTAGDKSCSNDGDGKLPAPKSRKRKRNSKQNNGRELSDHSAGANGMALVSNLQGTLSAHDTGDDKSYLNGQSDEQAVGVPGNNQGRDESTHQLKVDQNDSDKGNIDGVSGKHKRKRKRNKANIFPDGHVDGISCHVILEKEICADETPCEKTIAAGELRTQAVDIPNSNQGEDESTCQLEMDQKADAKSCIDVGSGKCRKKRRRNKGNKIIPNEHEGAVGISSHLNLEKGVCVDEAQGEKTTAVESSKQALGVPDNNQGGDELTCKLQMDKKVGGECSIQEGTDGLSIASESSKRAVGVPGNNQVGDELTSQWQMDRKAGGESGTDGGSRKQKRKRKQKKGNAIPNERVGLETLACGLNLEETVCASGHEGDKNNIGVISLERKQGQTKGDFIPDNIVGGGQLSFSNSREAVYATPTETNGNCMDSYAGKDGLACDLKPKEMGIVNESVSDENSRSKKRRHKKRKREQVEIDGNILKPKGPGPGPDPDHDHCPSAILDNNAVVKDSSAIQIPETLVVPV